MIWKEMKKHFGPKILSIHMDCFIDEEDKKDGYTSKEVVDE